MILGLDFETTWTNPVNAKIARPIELGAVLYDEKLNKVLEMESCLIYDTDHPDSPKELEDLTGINDDMRKQHGVAPKNAFITLNRLMEKSDFVVAHNGTFFDKIIYEEECDRLGLKPVEKLWIDTKSDIPFKPGVKTTKLTYLCAEHGFVNPFAHRALFDVLSMIKILSYYNFDEILKLSKEPTYKVVAKVSYEKRQEAKDRGYHWNGEEKQWVKHLKESKVKQEEVEAPFLVEAVLL